MKYFRNFICNVDHELLRELLSRHTGWELSDVEVVHTGRYWIDIEPDHGGFWESFKKRFDPDLKKALKLDAHAEGRYCPTFSSIQCLFAWLAECTGDRTFLFILFVG